MRTHYLGLLAFFAILTIILFQALGVYLMTYSAIACVFA